MKRFKLFATVLMVAMCAVGVMSCSDNDENEEETEIGYIYCDITKCNFTSEKTEEIILFDTNKKWEIECNADWIIIEPLKGEAGKNSITIKVTKNDSCDERKTQIFITTEDYKSEMIEVVQNAADRIEIKETNFEYDAIGGLYKTSIETNLDIETITEDWIITSYDKETKQLYICISFSQTKEKRNGVVICKEKNGTLSDTVFVSQEGLDNYQREQLIALYTASNGSKWTNNTNWCSEKPIEEWYGIAVDSSGRIKEINLAFNNLSGTFNYKGFKLDKIYCNNNPNLISINMDITFFKSYTFPGGFFQFGSENGALEQINCSNCNISTFNISNVRSLSCDKNVISKIEFDKLTSLASLSCSDNNIASLNFNKCPNLNSISCSNNRLTSIDISECPKVQVLWCNNNSLTSIKLGNSNNDIYDINCSSNRLGNAALNDLYYSLPRKSGGLRVNGNIGQGTQSIATGKGWRFW